MGLCSFSTANIRAVFGLVWRNGAGSAVDEFHGCHARLTLADRVGVPAQLPREITRRRQSDGSLWLVLTWRLSDPWPVVGMHPGARLGGLGLEGLAVVSSYC